jgi:hypothetical protein
VNREERAGYIRIGVAQKVTFLRDSVLRRSHFPPRMVAQVPASWRMVVAREPSIGIWNSNTRGRFNDWRLGWLEFHEFKVTPLSDLYHRKLQALLSFGFAKEVVNSRQGCDGLKAHGQMPNL